MLFNMNSFINKNRKLVLIAIDTLSIFLSFFIAFLLRFDFKIPTEFLPIFFYVLPFITFLQVFTFYVSGFYNVIWRFTSLWDMIGIAKAIIISNSITIMFLGFSTGFSGYPRSIFFIFFFFFFLITSLSRILVRLYHSHYKNFIVHKNSFPKKRLILIGAGKTGEKIIRELKSSRDSAYTPIGLVDDDLSIQGSTIHGIRVLGLVSDLTSIAQDFDEILITAPSASVDQLRIFINICKNTGKKYKTVPSLSELIDKDVSISTIRNVSYKDLLGREEVKLDMNSIEKIMNGKRVLITGAGGSIGSELVIQCLKFNPSEIICLDNSEENIFNLEQKLSLSQNRTIIKYYLCTINDKNELAKPFLDNRPHIVLHAAAYKHVPIQENHPWSSVKTNIGGTLRLVKLSDLYKVDLFVLVSTDKAVNPVNVMGATKRVSEKIIQSYNQISKTSFMAVRFGNVLGSSGSAIPIFEKQIKNGGPLTITHPEMTRYFMSIQEASQLILQCAALGKDGEIFLLEMGKPIKILQMAKDLIRLSGLEPDVDIPIAFTGIRPGEKLYEELQLKDEKKANTDHNKIMILKDENLIELWSTFKIKIKNLLESGEELNVDKIQKNLKEVLPNYQPLKFSNMGKSRKSNFQKIKIQA